MPSPTPTPSRINYVPNAGARGVGANLPTDGGPADPLYFSAPGNDSATRNWAWDYVNRFNASRTNNAPVNAGSGPTPTSAGPTGGLTSSPSDPPDLGASDIPDQNFYPVAPAGDPSAARQWARDYVDRMFNADDTRPPYSLNRDAPVNADSGLVPSSLGAATLNSLPNQRYNPDTTVAAGPTPGPSASPTNPARDSGDFFGPDNQTVQANRPHEAMDFPFDTGGSDFIRPNNLYTDAINRPHEGVDYVDPYRPVGPDDALDNLPNTVYDETPPVGPTVQVNPTGGPDLSNFGGGFRRDNNINSFGGLMNLGNNLAYNTYGQHFAAFPQTNLAETTRPSLAGFDINYADQNINFPGVEDTTLAGSNPESDAQGARDTAAARASGDLPPSTETDPEADVQSASAVSPDVRAALPATRAGEILLGRGPNGQAMFNSGNGWELIGSAPADLRFAQNSGTGNFQADQFTNAYQLGGGDPGSPNRPPASDRGHDMFFGGGQLMGKLDEDGNVIRVANPNYGKTGRHYVTPTQAESNRLGLSQVSNVAAYNAWIMAHNPAPKG